MVTKHSLNNGGGKTGRNWHGVTACTTCGKQCYLTRRDAKKAADALYPAERLSVYMCGDYWHYGHLSNAVRFGVLPRGVQG